MTRSRGLLVTRDVFVNGARGGVQACTAEYRSLIEGAGIELETLTFKGDRRLTTRLLRRVNPSPYWRPMEQTAIAEIAGRVRSDGIAWLFFNQVALSPVAEALRPQLPQSVRIVLLSHGLESTDLLNHIRARRRLPLSGRVGLFPGRLFASVVRCEAETREAADLVLTISPFDTQYERWIGAKNTLMVPRTVTEPLLANWTPRRNRMGFVGTIDHAPNLEGLVAVLDELQNHVRQSNRDLRIRVVGGPERLGSWLKQRYSQVDYLGPLADSELRLEAETWSAFIHPIFGVARGCSTKLSTALGWGLPIVTTPDGRRGYVWREGGVIEVESATAFVAAMLRLADSKVGWEAALEVRKAAATSPTLHDLASSLADKLNALAVPS